jgi:hypothetical protein
MDLAENLVKNSGPLLTICQLARILDRSPEGLRVSLRKTTPWVQRINATRLRLGRRVYFRTAEIAAILSEKEIRG